MARTFAGGASTDIVTIADQTQIHDIRPVTVAFWLYHNSMGSGDDYLVAKWPHDAATGEWDVQFGLSRLEFFADWTTNYGAWSVGPPSTGQWAHVLVTYAYGATTDDPVMYINGVSQSVTEDSTPAGSPRTGSNQAISIGNSATGTRALDGALAEVGFWNRILSADEIKALSLSYAPSFFSRGLAAYLPLVGRNSPEPNIATGGGNAGTVTGTVNFGHPRIIYPTTSIWRNNVAAAAPTVGQPYVKRLTGVPHMQPNLFSGVW